MLVYKLFPSFVSVARFMGCIFIFVDPPFLAHTSVENLLRFSPLKSNHTFQSPWDRVMCATLSH